MNETFVVSSLTTPKDGISNDTESCIFAYENGQAREENLRKCIHRQRLLIVFLCACTILSVSAYIYVLGPILFESNLKFHHFEPTAIDVQHYRLRLEPDLEKGTFKGRASIIFSSKTRTKELILVAHSLSISNVSVTQRILINIHPWHNDNFSDTILQRKQTMHVEVESGTHFTNYSTPGVAQTYLREQLAYVHSTHVFGEGQYAILLKDPLNIGEYMLDVYFSGSLTSRGFHQLHYEDILKDTVVIKRLFIIQDACRTFPFFENGKPMSFEVSVVRPTDMIALSNTKVRETETLQPGYIWEHFNITPKVLPSAIALIICEYKAISISQERETVVLSLYIPHRFTESTQYVMTIFPIIFRFYEEYFRHTSFPIEKLDLVLVDGAPASSKVGLVSLNSDQLLLNAVSDNVANRQAVFSAVSKAIAIQWLPQDGGERKRDGGHIGGVSKFLAYVSALDLKEQATWNADEKFILSVVYPTLKRLEESFATDSATNDNDKFACVLKMAYYALGKQRFKQEIKEHLQEMTQGNFTEISRSSNVVNLDLMNIVASWMRSPSYPVINVQRSEGWTVVLEQKSILLDVEFRNDTFLVPMTYVSQSAPSEVHNMTMDQAHIERNLNVNANDWILFNIQQAGLYRVNYDEKTWTMLIHQLYNNSTLIPVINRAQLINDAFALADASMRDHSIAFNLLKYISINNETSFMPWRAAIDSLNRYEMIFVDSTNYGIFRKFKVDLLSPLWLKRGDYNIELTHLIESELCKLQYRPCIDWALNFYDKYKHRKDINIPSWVYCTAMRSNDEEEFDLLFKLAIKSPDLRFKRKTLQSLACSTMPFKINSLLELSISSKEYAVILWPAFAANEISRWTALQFVEEKWKKLTQFLEDESRADIATVVIDSYLSTFTTTINLKKVQAFYESSNKILHNHFHQVIANIVRHIEWTTRHSESFIKFLLNHF